LRNGAERSEIIDGLCNCLRLKRLSFDRLLHFFIVLLLFSPHQKELLLYYFHSRQFLLDFIFDLFGFDCDFPLKLQIAFRIVKIFKMVRFYTTSNKLNLVCDQLIFEKVQFHLLTDVAMCNLTQLFGDLAAFFNLTDKLKFESIKISQRGVCMV
jgi:hypothetical protein